MIGEAWVSVAPLSTYTRERLAVAGERADVTHRVEMARPDFDIPASAQIEVSGTVYEVGPRQSTPNSRDIVLMCMERQV